MFLWRRKKVRVTSDIEDVNLQTVKAPMLLLHCCCAPCTTAVLERLLPEYDVTLFFCNSNIDSIEEFNKRASEMRKINHLMLTDFCSDSINQKQLDLIIHDYDNIDFEDIFELSPNEPEGGKRCHDCIGLRLKKTMEVALSGGFDYFTTTLSVSPHKNAFLINLIGNYLVGDNNKVCFLEADFKKQDGFKRSVELSKQIGLYRQNYCGCVSSVLK